MTTTEQTISSRFLKMGFTEQESGFLVRIGSLTGAFVMNQFRTWRGGKAGAADQSFAEKLRHKGFVALEPGMASHILRLTSKPLYRALGMPDSRFRRPQSPSKLRVSLLLSDYVCQCRYDFLLSPAAKIELLCNRLRIPERIIPHSIYVSKSGRSTVQYFTDRMLLFAREPANGELEVWGWDDPLDPTPVLGLVFAEDPNGSHYELHKFVKRNAEFLKRVPRLHFVYVSPNALRIEMAKRFLTAFGKEFVEFSKVIEQEAEDYFRLAQLEYRNLHDDYAWTNEEYKFYGQAQLKPDFEKIRSQVKEAVAEGWPVDFFRPHPRERIWKLELFKARVG